MALLEKDAVEEVADSQAEERRLALTRELFDEIRTEAYFLWQKRGSPPGDGLRDWYAAQEKVIAEANGL